MTAARPTFSISVISREPSEADSNVTSGTRDVTGRICKRGVRLLTSQVHPGLETLPYATRRTVFPSDLVNDAVISPGTQVVVLTYRKTRHGVSAMVMAVQYMQLDVEQR